LVLAAVENNNRQVEIAKIMVKNILVGFCNDLESYSKSNQVWSNENSKYTEFVARNNRLDYHLFQFIQVSNKIDAVGVLPDTVSDKLIEFTTQMRLIAHKSNFGSSGGWGRESPSSIPNLFDELLADIKTMYENLDEICSAGK
jgi:hypothetical protein